MSHPSVTLAGRYRLESLVAAGGTGQVWRATDLVLDRPVAVKLLGAEYASHPETLARFRAEARHAGSVSDPAIARVYDYEEAGPPGSPYLVMELVDGPSLAGVLSAGPLEPARAMDVVAQTAAGLAAAHAAGLVHRDIKPANLLLGRDGQVKITDFGIAHAAGSAHVTQAGTLVGTPAYLAPERAAGAPATPASDLYSLGVVAYECLAGAVPFSGPPLEVAAAHRHRPFPPLPPGVPPGVAGLVAELTAKDPSARPASAATVAARARHPHDALAGSGSGFLVSTGLAPSGAGADGARTERLAGAGAATLVDLTPLGRPPVDPQPRRAGSWTRGRAALVLAAALVIAGLAGWLLAGVSGVAGPRDSTGPPTATTGSGSSAAGMVTVNGGLLAGQPVSVVRQRLRQLGLEPRVVWAPGGGQPPGTVISVQPAGQVPIGSIVVVTAAVHSHGHGKGKEDGGNQNGDSGD